MGRFRVSLIFFSILFLSSCYLTASLVSPGSSSIPSNGITPNPDEPGTPEISEPTPFTLTSIYPNFSNTLGGVTVTLIGTGFAAGANITIGPSPCANIVVVSDTMITCVTPSLPVGNNDVVLHLNSKQQTLSGGFKVTTLLGLVSASSGNILLYSHNPADGSLTFGSSTSSSGAVPRGIHFSKGQRLYVINSGDAKISAYTFEMTNFTLTQLSGSPYTVAGCTSMKGSAISPNFRYLYVSCEASNNFFVYNILSDGTLTLNSGPYSFSQAKSINVHGAGSIVLVTGYSTNATGVFIVNGDDGTLSNIESFSVLGQNANTALFGDFFYAPRWGVGTVQQFGSNSGSSFVALNPAAVTSGTNSYSISISPDGNWANSPREAVSGDLLDNFSRSNSTGQLTPLASVNTGTTTNLRVSTYDPNSRYLYVAGNNSSLLGYSVNQLTGALTVLTDFPLSLGSNGNVYGISAK